MNVLSISPSAFSTIFLSTMCSIVFVLPANRLPARLYSQSKLADRRDLDGLHLVQARPDLGEMHRLVDVLEDLVHGLLDGDGLHQLGHVCSFLPPACLSPRRLSSLRPAREQDQI